MPIDILHNERGLFSQLALGNEKAFTEIFYYYSRKLHSYILKKTKSEEAAEEIIQDVFLKIWVNRERLGEMENAQGYIYKIAANLLLDHFRKQAMEYKILNRFQNAKPALSDSSGHGNIDLRETQKIIDQAVHQLPDQRKLIYVLRQDGKSYEEIAVELNLSINTVRNQLVAAGKFIRGYLVQSGISSLALISFYTTL